MTLADKIQLLREHITNRNTDQDPKYGIRLTESDTLTAQDCTEILEHLIRHRSTTNG